MRNKILILECMLICTMFSGCFDSIEAEDRNYAITMGIDIAKENNPTSETATSLDSNIVLSLATAKLESSTSLDDESKQKAIRINGNTLDYALQQINEYDNKEMYFGQTKVVVLGKSVLENENLCNDIITALENRNDISRKCIVVTSESPAYDVIEMCISVDEEKSMYIWDYFKDKSRTHYVQVGDMITSKYSGKQLQIPIIKLTDNGFKFDNGYKTSK